MSTRRLFIDNEHIASKKNLIRRYHPAVKCSENPVLVPDLPWERSIGHSSGTIRYDDGLFRLWYQVYTMPDSPVSGIGTFHIAYAESDNGYSWRKPHLGIVDFHGSRKNNLVMLNAGWGNFFEDPHETDSARKFKMLYLGQSPKESPGTFKGWMGMPGYWGWCAAFSPDRFKWERYADNPVYTAAADGGTLFGWDEKNQEYVAYLIPRITPYERTVGRTGSKDFISWGKTELIIGRDELDPPGTEFYPMTVYQYQDWYLGFIYALYCHPDEPLTRMRGFMDVQLAFSRDGRSWQRPNARLPIIPRGFRGSFDAGMVGLNNGLVETDGRIWFFYNAWTGEHFETKAYRYATGHVPPPGLFEMGRLCSGLGLAHLRQDGFVSMTAGEQAGDLVTQKEKFSKAILVINAVTRPAGAVAAEIQTPGGQAVKGYEERSCDPFRGNCIDHGLTWQGRDTGSLPEGEYRIRFTLRNADLYSYSI